MTAQADDEGEDGDLFRLRGAASLRTHLFGEWQTEPWVPPRATGGIVPKDSRGSVKVPPMSAGLPTARTIFCYMCGPIGMCVLAS